MILVIHQANTLRAPFSVRILLYNADIISFIDGEQLKKHIEKNIKPAIFNLNKYNSISIKKLAAGCYNVNYLVKINSNTINQIIIYKIVVVSIF